MRSFAREHPCCRMIALKKLQQDNIQPEAGKASRRQAAGNVGERGSIKVSMAVKEGEGGGHLTASRGKVKGGRGGTPSHLRSVIDLYVPSRRSGSILIRPSRAL